MKRSEQKKEDTWDLESLFETSEAWKQRYDETLTDLPALKKSEGKLKDSEALFATLEKLTEILIKLEEVSSYAMLSYEADAESKENQQNYGLASVLMANFSETISYLEPEIMALDEATVREWMKEPRYEPYRVWIDKLFHNKPHTLSQKEERILALNAEASSACSEAFHDLNDVDMKFGSIDGIELTHASYQTFLHNPDPKIREKAYKQYYDTFDSHKHVLARLYSGSVKQDIFEARSRNYKSTLEAALYPDNVSEAVYRNLIVAAHDGFPELHRYYEVMARVLKQDMLHHYDVYLPLVSGIETNIPYDQAVEMIKNAVAPLGEEYQTTLVNGLTSERWVDKYENAGKRSGAFSSGGFTGKPYILTNYRADLLNSVFTLIHEGGHSMHSYYSARNNPFMSYNYTIFEAEVASTFNEELLFRYLLNTTDDKKMKAYLLSDKLASLVATFYRQTMFAEFELLSHEEAEKGGVVTLDFIRSTYRELLKSYFGPVMELEDVSDLEALRIPHFYRAYYVYKYATGQSAAIKLVDNVTGGGERERDAYLGFLKSGGSKYPIDSLKAAGADLSKKESLLSTVKYFGSLLDEFEKLI